MSQFMVRLRRDVCQIMTASKHDETLYYFMRLTRFPLIIYPFASRRTHYSLWLLNFLIFYFFCHYFIDYFIIHEGNMFDILYYVFTEFKNVNHFI